MSPMSTVWSADRSSNGTPARLQLDLTVGGAKSVAGLTSPSHTLVTDETGAIHFAQGVALDRDVVIQWHATAQAMGVTAVEGPGLPGDDGRYVLVTVVPPTQPASVFTRELTILLDTSGSMRGDRLEHAKRVVGDLLRSLEPQDAFELLEFNTILTRHTPGKSRIAASSSAIAQTLAILDTLVAQGGTELHDAIRVALADLSASAQRQIVLLTDGDVNFESEVVGEVAASGNARLHVVAIGAAPNRALTQQAAMAGRGLELLVSDEASAARAAERLVKNTAHPVLTQLTLSGTAVVRVSRSRLCVDVFAGQPLLIPVEVSAQGGTLILQGLEAGYETPWTWSTELSHVGAASQRTLTSLPLGAILGRVRVSELEMQHALHGVGGHSRQREGQATTIDQRIEKVALRHRIVSRRTSLVAIAETPSSDPNQPRRQVEIEVEMPSDVEMFMDELAPSVGPVSTRHVDVHERQHEPPGSARVDGYQLSNPEVRSQGPALWTLESEAFIHPVFRSVLTSPPARSSGSMRTGSRSSSRCRTAPSPTSTVVAR
jgi:Ca-activated chloride channel family protein